MTHLLFSILFACTGEPSDDKGSGVGGGSDSGSPSPDDSGDDGTDTGPTNGRLYLEGQATIVDAWVGTEELYLKADLGLGQTDCHVRMAVASTGPAMGCDDCLYAWDVTVGAPEVITDTHCADAGWDASAIAGLEGTTRTYGVAIEYVGHSDVLMEHSNGSWDVIAYVDWNASAGSITYTWDLAYETY